MQIYIVFQNFTKYNHSALFNKKECKTIYTIIIYIIRTTNAILFSISLFGEYTCTHFTHPSFNLQFLVKKNNFFFIFDQRLVL